jgi:hypothetical protein
MTAREYLGADAMLERLVAEGYPLRETSVRRHGPSKMSGSL